MSGQHAKFAPSAAPELAYCTGSLYARMSVPDTETPESREGDAAHWLVAECLVAWRDGNGGDLGIAAFYLGRSAPNGVVIDDDIVASAEVMVGEVLDVCNEYGGLQYLRVEYRVHMPAIHPTDCWGTLDCAIILPAFWFVFDFKHGHVPVAAFENYQGVEYIEGLREEAQVDGWDDQGITVDFRIVQPRCYRQTGPVDSWVFKLSELRGYVNHMASQVHEAETNPQMCAGKHCRFCPARGQHCAAARGASMQWVSYGKEPFVIETMDSHDLAAEYRIIDEGVALLKARKIALADDLEHRISAGAADTGFTMQAGKGNNNWTVPAPQAVAFCRQFGIEPPEVGVKVMTPTQAVQKVSAAMRSVFKDALKAVSGRKSSGLSLVEASDSRTARAFKRK